MSEDEIILTHILQCRSIDLIINKPVLTASQKKQFESYQCRRKAGEPLQYILGACNFMGLELVVNPSVLIPRPETEQLVDTAIKHIKGTVSYNSNKQSVLRFLDLGTGSGNIAIALAKFVPGSQVISIDISVESLEVARANAKFHNVDEHIKFIHADILSLLRESVATEVISERRVSSIEITSLGAHNDGFFFDLIISNPPYIPTQQLSSLPRDVQREPMGALDGGADGLDFYRNIIKYTPHLLREGACLMMEFGDGQVEAIKSLVECEKIFSNIEIVQDLAGRDRIIKVIL